MKRAFLLIPLLWCSLALADTNITVTVLTSAGTPAVNPAITLTLLNCPSTTRVFSRYARCHHLDSLPRCAPEIYSSRSRPAVYRVGSAGLQGLKRKPLRQGLEAVFGDNMCGPG